MTRTCVLAAAVIGTLLVPSFHGLAQPSDNVVIEWNDILPMTISPGLGPIPPRYYAMLHVAMCDAIKTVERGYQTFHARARPSTTGSPEAAAAHAGHDVLAAR